ncbi:MAG: AAA family ATPase [Thermaerobacter sp.]|jgi:predicted AAA+ superfamily ATPase|nr:AAA family ATPase [Thermaerobacter sp.]
MIIQRAAEGTVRELARGYPVVAIPGLRQSRKTTLARMVFADKPYVSLEDLDQREFAEEDPRGFLGRYPAGAVLEEVQRCPTLFSYLQTVVERMDKAGFFILTGSQQFRLLAGVSQSLAGRVGLLSLLPLSLRELQAAGRAPRVSTDLMYRVAARAVRRNS